MAHHLRQSRRKLGFEIFVGVDVEEPRQEPLTGGVLDPGSFVCRQLVAFGRNSAASNGDVDVLRRPTAAVEDPSTAYQHIPAHVLPSPVHSARYHVP